MREGLVSVIIPVHNRPALLREAVDSVLAQTYPNFEIIIVDDGSTDGTPRVIEQLVTQEERIAGVRQANAGPGAAREAGRQRARGEFIQYLDSDDLLLPRKFELQVHALGRSTEAAVAYGRARYTDPSGGEVPSHWRHTRENLGPMFPSFLLERQWDTPTALYRKAVCDRAGSWSSLRAEEDWEYDCRIAALGTHAVFVPDVVVVIRDPGSRLSSRGTADTLADRARAHELILGHAQRAGVAVDVPEMQHFARELFLLSRQCGAAGLAAESKRLFELAREASGRRGRGIDFRLYGMIARTIGWNRAGKLAVRSDRFRRAR